MPWLKSIKPLFFIAFVFAPLAATAALDLNTPKTLTADKITYDARGGSLQISGGGRLETADGQTLTMGDSYFSGNGQNIAGRNLDLNLGNHMRLSAETMERAGFITRAERAVYTACDGCDEGVNAWEIHAEKLKHDNSERIIYMYDATLRVYDIPVFWLPYMSYPDPSLKYKSGFLTPNFETTNDMGYRINFPLYLNFSDYHDLTLVGGYQTAENPLYQAEHRLNYDHSSFRTNGSYTYDENAVSRWHLFNNSIMEFGENVRSEFNIQQTSDKLYLQKYGFYNDQPYLESQGRVEYFTSRGYITTSAHLFQELRSEIPKYGNTIKPSGDILPQVHGIYQSQKIFGTDAFATAMGDVLFVSNSDTGTAAQRAIGALSLESPFVFWNQKLTVSAMTRYDIYKFANTDMTNGDLGFNGTDSRFLTSGYLDWTMPFLKSGESWSHIIAPRARLTIMNKLDNAAFAVNGDSSGSLISDATLFSINRFSGYDVWENGNYADYGLDWTAFNSDGLSANAFIGQSYDFSQTDDIDVNSGYHNGGSDLVGRIGVGYDGFATLSNRFRFAQDSGDLRHLESVVHLGDKTYMDIGYIYATQLQDANTIESTASEVMAGFGFNITARLSLNSTSIYNISEEHLQRQSFGIAYNHPCYALIFALTIDGARRYDWAGAEVYRGRTNFRLQFSMKLGGENL
ncbi:MAG: LPS assembly protein LptD [Rickettsiales bacterium]|jgi:LPS-assembly protein|nr:LPS assembly protein LptD [Rickettsiales bacterium]